MMTFQVVCWIAISVLFASGAFAVLIGRFISDEEPPYGDK